MPDQVIGIRFGVAGGDSISGESGREIKRQLDAIASQIQLKINIDKKHFQDQVNAMKAELEKAVGNLPINIRTNTVTGSSSGGSSGSGSGGAISPTPSGHSQDYQVILRQIEQAQSAASKLFSTLDQDTNLFGLQKDDYTQRLVDIDNSITDMVSRINGSGVDVVDPSEIQELQQLRAGLKTVLDEAERIAHAKQDDKMVGMESAYEGLIAKVRQLNQQHADLIAHNEDAQAEMDRLNQIASKPLSGNYEEAKQQIRELTIETRKASGRFSEMEVKADTLGNKLRKTFTSKILQTFAYALIGLGTRALRQVYDNITNIDKAMTSLKIVTNATTREIEDFTKSVTKSAQKIGKSVNDLIESTTVFARLGYSLSEAAKLAEKTTMYSNVSGVAANEATTNITAIIKAFKVGADDLEGVLDKLIYVGNNYAISSGEIGEGMNNAASALAANGNTLEEAIGILTAANVTVQNASKSSTAVRTIAARMSASVTDLEDLGESSDGLLSTAKLAEQMKAYGISILNVNGSLRSTYDVLKDIAKIWNQLETTDQSAIAGMLAGTRQQNAFYSIMQNWSDAESVVNNIADSYGSLGEANAKYIDSIEGRINSLKATWESFSNGLINSTLFKGLIDVLSLLAKTINLVVDGSGGMLLIVGGLTAGIALLVDKLQTYRLSLIENTEAETAAAMSLKNGLLKVIQNQYVWLAILAIAMTAITKHAKQWGKVIPGIIMLITAAVLLAIKTTRTAIASNWIVLAIAVIVSAVYLLVDGIKELVNTTQKAIDKAKESKEAWEETVEEIKDIDSQIDQLRNRLNELMEISAAGKITLIEQEELEKTSHAIELLQTEKQLLEDLAKERKKDAERDATNAFNSILNETVTDAKRSGTTKWYHQLGRYLATELSFGVSDAVFGYGVIDDNISRGTKEQIVNSILNNWNSASQEDRDYAWQFYDAIKDQKDMLSYHSGDNLAQWEKDANAAYNKYYEYVHKFILTSGKGLGGIWDSILSMERFDGVKDKLKEIANAGNVTSDSLRNMYNTDAAFKDMIDYLRQLGLFSWDDTTKVSGLVNQINNMSDAMSKGSSAEGFIDILEKVQDKFDTLNKALSDIEKNGIISADTVSDLLSKYPSLAKFFKLTAKGYMLNDAYGDTGSVLDAFETEFLSQYEEALDKCTEGTQEYTEALNQRNRALAVFATLRRTSSDADDLETKRLNAQLDAVKEIVDIRKDLLKTYADEISYQKTLAQKQKSVADLQTKLTLASLDKSAAGQANARKLQEDLDKAQDELDDFTLEHAIDIIINDIDDTYQDYKEFIEGLIDGVKEEIARAASAIEGGDEVPDILPNGSATSTSGAGGSGGSYYEQAKKYILDHGMMQGDKNRWGQDPAFRELWNKLTDEERSSLKGYTYGEAELDANGKLIRYKKVPPVYHSGGFVGDESTLKSNELYAKLLKGEFVATPSQMDSFIKTTVPALASRENGASIQYNSPLIEINCDSITEDSLPKLKDIIDMAVGKIKTEMSAALGRTGYRKSF